MRAALLVVLGLAACVPQRQVELTPEAAVGACAIRATAAARDQDAGVRAVQLGPPGAARLERGPRPFGRETLGLVVRGRGRAEHADGSSPISYLCLIDRAGQPLWVEVTPVERLGAEAGCPGPTGPNRRRCLAGRLASADTELAAAEALALRAIRARAGNRPWLEVEDPVVTAIGAWRVYRDAECSRRGELADAAAAEVIDACRIELTRARIEELEG